MTNMYETWLMEQIHSIANFPYEDIKILDKYPLDVSKQKGDYGNIILFVGFLGTD